VELDFEFQVAFLDLLRLQRLFTQQLADLQRTQPLPKAPKPQNTSYTQQHHRRGKKNRRLSDIQDLYDSNLGMTPVVLL
jgi:hypothetical protein